ncbi:hypothetical protein E2C01_099310 [Portunus trituberculatus]|uniref:Uncharacterized protein n=1 Tax=Portunus trituberculatus TaxID=210409 RepID=A0A5B7KGJ3_PORTR|nr:hypothetical protein [Portunus trituberculatus]
MHSRVGARSHEEHDSTLHRPVKKIYVSKLACHVYSPFFSPEEDFWKTTAMLTKQKAHMKKTRLSSSSRGAWPSSPPPLLCSAFLSVPSTCTSSAPDHLFCTPIPDTLSLSKQLFLNKFPGPPTHDDQTIIITLNKLQEVISQQVCRGCGESIKLTASQSCFDSTLRIICEKYNEQATMTLTLSE